MPWRMYIKSAQEKKNTYTFVRPHSKTNLMNLFSSQWLWQDKNEVKEDISSDSFILLKWNFSFSFFHSIKSVLKSKKSKKKKKIYIFVFHAFCCSSDFQCFHIFLLYSIRFKRNNVCFHYVLLQFYRNRDDCGNWLWIGYRNWYTIDESEWKRKNIIQEVV